MRIKIADGDLLFVCVHKETSQSGQNELSKCVNNWLNKRGLRNVSAYIVSTNEPGIKLQCLSVNDVFEEEVLKGDNNG